MEKIKIQRFRKRFMEQMEVLEKEFGLSIMMKTISYSAEKLSFSTEAFATDRSAILDEKEKALSLAAIDYKEACGKFGLNARWLGKTFVNNGKKFKIIGLKKRARKYPLLAQDLEIGKEYAMTANAAIMYFKAHPDTNIQNLIEEME